MATDRERELESALRGLLAVSGTLHKVELGPNARWIGEGEDIYYDYDEVDAPDCLLCEAERRAREVLGAGLE